MVRQFPGRDRRLAWPLARPGKRKLGSHCASGRAPDERSGPRSGHRQSDELESSRIWLISVSASSRRIVLIATFRRRAPRWTRPR